MKALFACALVCALAATASADPTVTWEGILWNSGFGGADLNLSGPNMTVTPVGSSYGAAHYNTPVAFRASPEQFVEVGFIDTGLTERVQIWMEDENTALPIGSNGAWVQFGSWELSGIDNGNYQIYLDDYDADRLDDGSVNFSVGTFIDTGVAYSAGTHTLGLGMRADGTVDFLLDGALVLSTTAITPNYFGDIYLAGRYGTATFTSYTAKTAYAPPVPEPSGLALAVLTMAGIAVRRRNRARPA